MALAAEEEILEGLVKNQVQINSNDFLLRVFLFIVQKSYETGMMSLKKAVEELHKFFEHYADFYDLDQIVKLN